MEVGRAVDSGWDAKPPVCTPLYVPFSASPTTYLLDALLFRSGDTVVAVAGVPRSAFPLYMYSGSRTPADGPLSIDRGCDAFFLLYLHRKNPRSAKARTPTGTPMPTPSFIPRLLGDEVCVITEGEEPVVLCCSTVLEVIILVLEPAELTMTEVKITMLVTAEGDKFVKVFWVVLLIEVEMTVMKGERLLLVDVSEVVVDVEGLGWVVDEP